MDVDFDTFLTTVYVLVDTFCQEHPLPPQPGHPSRMSESEVLTLALLGHWRGASERALLRWAGEHLRAAFPQLLGQSAFNRRVRREAARFVALMEDVADTLGVDGDAYEIVDGVPVPLAQQCRGEQQRRFPEEVASVGRGGVGKSFYYGVGVVLSVAASGPITGFIVAPANSGERCLLGALAWWRQEPTAVPQLTAALSAAGARPRARVGPAADLLSPATVGRHRTGHYLADRGFTGAAWKTLWQALDATVWTVDELPEAVHHWMHHARQTVETVIGQLTMTLHLKFPLAHTQEGLMTRISAKCAALNLGLLVNHRYDRPPFALGTLSTG